MAEINITDTVDPAWTASAQTAEIQRILQLARTTGDSVYFPAREYLISDWIFDSSIGFKKNDPYKGITIRGDGPGKTIIKLSGNVAEPIFRVAGDLAEFRPSEAIRYKWFTLRDMTLDGNNMTATWIKFHRSDLDRLDNVEFKNTAGHAILGINFWDSLLYNCTYDNCDTSTLAAVHLEGEVYTNIDTSNNLKFDSCDWKNNTRSVLAFKNVKVCEFLSCRFQVATPTTSQFRLVETYGMAVSQSQFADNGKHVDVAAYVPEFDKGAILFASTFQNPSNVYKAIDVTYSKYLIVTADYFNSTVTQVTFGTGATDYVKAHNTPATA